ncbi:(P)ppGpp synthetase I, SpoT/RelA [Candidatus Saccharimonas aalborgensis]|uniref:(P)ppGpp synthetase I, SpoT/RelA n=1 Tax=Candidatus Saccharimonas aalborgensis TaxID=1332188 RepID=R4PUI8_9BACT|nr:RelA/SpoT family protein [Candidatus Saccharimonas aalborgensis]AGL61805.1 (P)ppGpp synthetase I, SpoT/RelA [Candidatus Saccharimonas aalborgensis]QQS68335.1 MAG: bifunctional (p)ppGpp synthetase/guanosine-3',5'-bis(diphosphate) 3'-pyrophosphohydrolase [Candidatus Saccharibacteria bacterium]
MDTSEVLRAAKGQYGKQQLLVLSRAIDYAAEVHKGQRRKSGEPYITHPLSVAVLLIEWGMDVDSVIAGILHDTVEDTTATLEQIEHSFGKDVAFLVDGVTKVSQARAGMQSLENYLPQTRDNLTKLLIAVGQDVRVIIIKLADRLHNMKTLQYKSQEKQKKIARETIEVFAPLADRLNMGRVRVQLEELSFRYLWPKEFETTKQLMDSRLSKSKKKLESVRREVDAYLTKEKIPHSIDGRVKSVYSLYKKLKRVPNIDDIYDLMALRIVVDDLATCYLVLGELHSLYEPMVDRIKDYIAKPKPNGYQSLHTTIITKNGQHVEFQVRTREMHEYAERGLAASFHYNEQKLTEAYIRGNMAELPADLHWIADLQNAAAQINEGKEFDVENLKVDLFGDRIFVFSPKGDIYDLPDGAFPLDYAYRVHSDLAARASGFMINGKMEPFSHQLQHGDVVEILTSKGAKPRPDWQQYVLTSHARMKLRAQLRKGGVLGRISNAASILHRKMRKNKRS